MNASGVVLNVQNNPITAINQILEIIWSGVYMQQCVNIITEAHRSALDSNSISPSSATIKSIISFQ